MRLQMIMLCVVVMACGGAERPATRPVTRQSSATVPQASGKVRLPDLLQSLESRLCQRKVASECKQALREVLASCGTADLAELARHDRVTEPCKAALWKLLPKADSHRSRVLVMGSARDGGELDVFVTASNADGEPALGNTRVYVEIGGRLELVERAGMSPLPARCDTPIFTASSILDYSGSMSDRDVDESIDVMRALYEAIPPGCLETDVILFSDTVRRTHGPTSDPATMQRAVARNDGFPRSSTALVDAVGDGVRSTSERRAPVRLAIVATDGQENASTRWSYAELVRSAQDGNVRVISFGSLLSDVGFLEQLGSDTGGFFIYRSRTGVLVDAARTAGRLLAATQRIRITDTRLSAATHVVVEHEGTQVRVPLR